MKLVLSITISLLMCASALADVSEAQKQDFLSRLNTSLADNSLAEYQALAYLEGTPEKYLLATKNMATSMLSALSTYKDGLTFTWKNISETEIQAMTYTVQGVVYQPNLTPEVTLVITFPPEAKSDPKIPTAIFPALGLHDGQLFFVGASQKN